MVASSRPLAMRPLVLELPEPAATAQLSLAQLSFLKTIVTMSYNLMPKNLIYAAATNNFLPIIIAFVILGLLVESKQRNGSDKETLKVINDLN